MGVHIVWIYLQFLGESKAIQETLQNDGWKLQWESEDSITAQHPLVQDEVAGRNRLHHLGLLTTRRARIEFIKSVDWRPRAQAMAPSVVL